jgi:hypothetical protein
MVRAQQRLYRPSDQLRVLTHETIRSEHSGDWKTHLGRAKQRLETHSLGHEIMGWRHADRFDSASDQRL